MVVSKSAFIKKKNRLVAYQKCEKLSEPFILTQPKDIEKQFVRRLTRQVGGQAY